MAAGLIGGSRRHRNGGSRHAAYRPLREINENKEPLVVTVNAEGKIFLQETVLDADDTLVPRLQAITHNNPEASIYVRGDRAINYGRVLEVMSMISAAGFTKVSLVAESPGSKSPPKSS